ncbi:MAG: TIGR03087 family PEP-CTERM/XrtA system glycosyltransferase [Acidobacteria bacterium]|jgi:sugar transferase (PEP-CTERM/EpsH1 system associated)|nr:TIGR03087 family PEP-CTERM/XrtA system glycosyltransferase [Acidobacteriota bacterium]
MRLLYLCQRIPYPPDRGDRIPVFHHIRHLGQNHEVVVGSLAHPGTRPNAERLRKELGVGLIAPDHPVLRRGAGMARAFVRREPLSLGYFHSPALQKQVDAEMARKPFDAVIVFSSSMAPYAEGFRGAPRIMHFCDVDSQKWASLAEHSGGVKRWVYGRESRLLLQYEQKIAAEFEASCVVSQSEAELFRAHIPGVPVQILENGVDTEHFGALPRRPEGTRIVFVGVMDYAPNVEAVTFFVEKVWPAIRAARPGARFVIAGAKPSREVRNLARRPGVEVTGYVPDIRTHLSAALVSIAPLAIARGVQNKILEAMAAGVPVLTTPRVAAGLPAGADDLVFTAERTPEDFSRGLLELLADANGREERARKALNYVRQKCGWEAKLQILDDLLAQVLETSRGSLCNGLKS